MKYDTNLKGRPNMDSLTIFGTGYDRFKVSEMVYSQACSLDWQQSWETLSNLMSLSSPVTLR